MTTSLSKKTDKTINAAQFASLVAGIINDASSNLSVNLPVLTKASASLIINMIFDTLLNEIKSKKSITTSIGKFKYTTKAARVCKNFATGKTINVPEKGAISFVPNSITKEALEKVL